MKRKNKCVAYKKAYATTDECLKQIKKVWRTQRRKLRYYECPVCLDFHLTSKGTKTEMDKLFKEWKQEAKVRNLKETVAKQYREFNRLLNKYCKDNGYQRKKPKTILKGTLPREERLKILAEMKARNSKIDQSKNLWKTIKSWFLGCIIK